MIPVFDTKERFLYAFLAILWLTSIIFFWSWWVNPLHWGNPILFWLMSLAFFYDATFLPSIYLFYLGKMRLPLPKNNDCVKRVIKKVAMITTAVPEAESMKIIERQIKAMSLVSYPHDSYIVVDREHSPQIKKIAEKYGVIYFSRKDVNKWGLAKTEKWNQPNPPFKLKTKAGNVNAWLDAYGSKYSHFTQLDIDHIPKKSYLDDVLPYFSDKSVAWVQAPSVYGNLKHWTARGSTEQELVLQGPLQMGFYGFCETPFIIGSHSTYDIKAIKKIGGFQPTRAEDHLDTVVLSSIGKKGVFLPKVIAVGDGPENFEMYLKQQFAWAYSMIQVLFNFTPKLVKHYSLKQAIQFLFVQTWYTFWSLSILTLFALPLLALFFDQSISAVSFFEFLAYSLPMTTTGFLIWKFSKKWHNPKGIGLSWRGIVLHAARWVIVFQALIQVILKIEKPYMITIKGIGGGKNTPLAIEIFYPFFILCIASLSASLFYNLFYKEGSTQGYLLFGIENAFIALVICQVVFMAELLKKRKSAKAFFKFAILNKKLGLMLLSLWTFWVGTLTSSGGKIASSMNYKTEINTNAIALNTDNNRKSSEKVLDEKYKMYTVKKGDSLWKISENHLGDGTIYKLIVRNSNSKYLIPGEVLLIPNEKTNII